MADSLVRRSPWNAVISPAILPSGASAPLSLPLQCERSKSRSRDSGARAALLRRIPSGEVRQAAAAPVARVTCVFGGNKRDAARKALESALGEKKEVFNKWDEEIKKREAGGGGGSKGRGRGWGGGDGRGDGEGDSGENWGGNKKSEALQVVYAFAGLASVYLILTKGSTMMAFVLNSILWVSRGFKPRAKPRYAPVASEDDEDAESHVRKKWGSDE